MHPFERWPASQKIAEQLGISIFEPFQNLRKIVLQDTAHAVVQAHFVSDQAPPMFDHLLQRTNGRTRWLERLEPITMFKQNLQLEYK